MTKVEFVAKMAQDTGLTKIQAKQALESFLTQTTKLLKKEGRFALTGLGIFFVETQCQVREIRFMEYQTYFADLTLGPTLKGGPSGCFPWERGGRYNSRSAGLADNPAFLSSAVGKLGVSKGRR